MPSAALGHVTGEHDDRQRLRELRRLHLDGADPDPALRPVDRETRDEHGYQHHDHRPVDQPEVLPKPPVIQQREHDGADETCYETESLVDGVELPVVGLRSVDGEHPDPTQRHSGEIEQYITAAKPVRDAYLLFFLAPGDGDRRTGPYCTHNPKIHNLRALSNAHRKGPLPGPGR